MRSWGGDGRWYARDPLLLEQGYGVIGHMAGDPDFISQLVLAYGEKGEPEYPILGRAITVTCPGGTGEMSAALYDASMPWNGTITCQGRTWRMQITKSTAALRPAVASAHARVDR